MTRESVIHRVLGAVRFNDATTGAPVTTALRLGGQDPAEWRRNAGGAYVLWRLRGQGLDAYTGDAANTTDAAVEQLFENPPKKPALATKKPIFTVEDPNGEYTARSFVFPLPRKPGQTVQDVRLLRTTAARPTGVGARVYALVQTPAEAPIPGAIVTVAIDGTEVGRGVTGELGEALVELPGLASFFPSNDELVITKSVKAKVAAKASLAYLKKDETGAWRVKTPPDPDGFTKQIYAATSVEVLLSAGGVAKTSLSIALP